MGKHTQGPWSRDKYGAMIDAMGDSVILRGTTTFCSGSDDRMAIAEANTDLACAAPELLEALLDIVNDYCDRFDMTSPSTNPGMKHVVQAGREAIAKARGEA